MKKFIGNRLFSRVRFERERLNSSRKAIMMDGIHSDHASDGSRRQFLKTAAAAGGAAAVASADAVSAQDPPASTVPMVTLGKTGQKVPVLGMGTSWDLSPSFVQAALHAGVRYIDTSESYEGGNCESTLGEVLERTKMRKDVYLVTKNSRGKVGGARRSRPSRSVSSASMDRLRTDYIDCYYLHGVAGREIALLSDPDVKAAFEKLKKSGKIKFCGLSLPRRQAARDRHGRRRERLDRPDHDPVQLPDNEHRRRQEGPRRGIEGQPGHRRHEDPRGAGRFREATSSPKFKEFVDKGFKKQAAAIKTVFADHRVHAVVSEMTNRDMLRENIDASRDHTLTLREQKQLEEYRQATAHLYCHGCGAALRAGRRRRGRVGYPPLLAVSRGLRQAPARRRAVQGPVARSPQDRRYRPHRRPGRLPARPADRRAAPPSRSTDGLTRQSERQSKQSKRRRWIMHGMM